MRFITHDFKKNGCNYINMGASGCGVVLILLILVVLALIITLPIVLSSKKAAARDQALKRARMAREAHQDHEHKMNRLSIQRK